MSPVSVAELRKMPPTVNVETAAAALGVSRAAAYDAIKADQFPAKVIVCGRRLKVATASLIALLDGGQAPAA
jgi:predicted DNA-binding transcriptional regulator AlpA